MKDSGYKPVTEIIRKRFIGYKLGRISKKYIDNMTKERRQLLDLIKQIDHNIESTDHLLESFMPNMTRMLQQKMIRKGNSGKQHESQILSEFWQEKRIQALERNDKDCPICYFRLVSKPVVLLDCSHVYHKQCLESFELYDKKPVIDRFYGNLGHNAGEHDSSKQYGHACPMCRHPKYKKVDINL